MASSWTKSVREVELEGAVLEVGAGVPDEDTGKLIHFLKGPVVVPRDHHLVSVWKGTHPGIEAVKLPRVTTVHHVPSVDEDIPIRNLDMFVEGVGVTDGDDPKLVCHLKHLPLQVSFPQSPQGPRDDS
jgi:hypothetical protein